MAEVCDDYGPRLTGSENLEKYVFTRILGRKMGGIYRATDYIVASLKEDGFDVHTEPVPGLKYWIRGEDSAYILGEDNTNSFIVI